jgi:hypothetical protein
MEAANINCEAEIDTLSISWETPEQWKLRRAFLKHNWNKMPLDRLCGRAQAFINMQFMGCSYVSFLFAYLSVTVSVTRNR